MKILTKHKDYYDYLIGIYGEDPLKVFDRRDLKTGADGQLSYIDKESYGSILYFCGNYYYIGASKFLTDDEMLRWNGRHKKVDSRPVLSYIVPYKYTNTNYNFREIELLYKDDEICIFTVDEDYVKNKYPFYWKHKHLIKSPYYTLPSYREDPNMNDDIERYISIFKPVLLKNYHLHKIINPAAAYIAIENYISKPDVNENLPGSPDDMIRFEQKGFKNKDSFISNKKS